MNSSAARKTSTSSKSAKPVAPVRRQAAARSPVVKSIKAAPVAEPPEAAPKSKHKLVRDSFTIPKVEYAVLESLKLRAACLARPIKKSELLRAGISALNAMSDKAFLAVLNGVPSLKTGRPSGKRATPAPSTKTAK